MKKDLEFAAGTMLGLIQAIRTDNDVFLIALAGLFLSIKSLKAIGIVLLFFVALRRADGLMSAYVAIKQKEIAYITSIKSTK